MNAGPEQTMPCSTGLLRCPLLENECSLEDLATANEKALHRARAWPNISSPLQKNSCGTLWYLCGTLWYLCGTPVVQVSTTEITTGMKNIPHRFCGNLCGNPVVQKCPVVLLWYLCGTPVVQVSTTQKLPQE